MKILSKEIMSTEQIESETDYVLCEISPYGDGSKRYYNEKGEYHRENGPAVEYADGSKLWYINDKLHREDGPAEELYNDEMGWFINDQRHREDGPAVKWVNGGEQFYLYDKVVDEETVRKLGKMK